MIEIHEYAAKEGIAYTTACLRVKQGKIKTIPGHVEKVRRVKTRFVVDASAIVPSARSECHGAEVVQMMAEIEQWNGHRVRGTRFICTKCGKTCKPETVK